MTIKKSLSLLFLLFLSPTLLMAEQYSEGVEYTKYGKPFPVSTGDKIEVREIFWYGCPHCYYLEEPLNKWLKDGIPANAKFVRMPGIFRDSWVPHARAYYSFDALDQTQKLHHELMYTMHVKKQKLMTEEQIADFVAAQGVDRSEFIDAYNSFSVDSLSRQARIMTKRYGITGVPSLIVDGRYLVSSSLAGGHEEMLIVVNYLVGLAAKDRESEKAATK